MNARVAGRLIAILAGIFWISPAAAQVQPGNYAISARITDISGPGVTADMVKTVTSGSPSQGNICLNVEDLQKLTWIYKCTAGMTEEASQVSDEENCVTEGTSSGGKIDLTSRCKDGTIVHSVGTYTPTTVAYSYKSTNSAGSLTIALKGKRIGECTEEAAPADDSGQ